MRFARIVRWSARGVGALLLAALVAGPASAGNGHGNKFHGKPMAEWMKLWFTWALGGDQADHVGNVQFLPLPAGVPVDDGSIGTADDPVTLVGEMDITLKPGTSFVLPVLGWTREKYLDLHLDPFLADSVFTDTAVYVTIDG